MLLETSKPSLPQIKSQRQEGPPLHPRSLDLQQQAKGVWRPEGCIEQENLVFVKQRIWNLAEGWLSGAFKG